MISMKNRILKLITESNIFAALGVWSLVKLTGMLHSVNVDDFAIFSFFSTLLVYSFSIIFSVARSSGVKSIFPFNKLLIQKIILVVSVIILPFYLFEFSMEVLLMLIPVGLVSFLYPVELISENKKGIALREFPYLKIFLIGISWGVVTVLLPLLETGVELGFPVFIETIVRSMFVVAITIPFDVRDMYSDSPDMKTIPQEIGASKAKILAYFLLIVNFVYFIYLDFLDVNSLFLIFATLLLTSILVRYSSSDKPKFYYAVFLESTSVLLFFSVYLSNFI